jgi:Ca-activated chloride channel family protein
MSFGRPLFLLLIPPVLALLYFYARGRLGREAAIRFSNLGLVQAAGARSVSGRRVFSALLKGLALVLFIVALARPQAGHGEEEATRLVVDMMISLDVSSSMGTLDFHPENRLEAAKLYARRFIEGREHDRIGLVVFSKHGVTQCPLTTDRPALLALLERVRMGTMEDGTAIGVGLAIAVNRLKESEAKSKVVVLLTDGVNNSGEIDPLTAGKIARKFGVRVYTIGMGVEGEALLPVPDGRGGTRLVRTETQIDEKTLEAISRTTGGRYFRVRDERALDAVFAEIDKLETTEVKVEHFTRYEDRFRPWLVWGCLLLLAELAVTQFVWVRIP